MINLLNSKSELKPDLIITKNNYVQLKKYLPDSTQEKLFLESIHSYCSTDKSPIPVYCFHNPDTFKDILTLRRINHQYKDDFLPNYSLVVEDFGQLLYGGEDIYTSFSFGFYNAVIRYNSFFGNTTGPCFLKDKTYIVGIQTTFSFETTMINIQSAKENNIYVYLPRKLK